MKSDLRRLNYIDISKTVVIVMMIMGHIGFGDTFYHYIHAFHMPFFFFVSGFLFNDKKDLIGHIKGRISTLIVPYLFVGICHYAIWFVIYKPNLSGAVEVLENLFWINTNLNMPIAGAIWFLTCLFFADIIFVVLKKVFKNRMIFAVVIILIAICGTVFTRFFDFRLPWALDASFTAVGFLYVGYLTKQWKTIELFERLSVKIRALIIIGSLLLVSWLIMKNSTINMRTGEYGVIPLFWINAILYSFMLLLLCKIIDQHTKENFLKKLTEFIGKNSIIFLCFNQFIILLCNKMFCIVPFFISSPFGVRIKKIITLIICVLVLYVISYIVMNTKLRVIFGRKSSGENKFKE